MKRNLLEKVLLNIVKAYPEGIQARYLKQKLLMRKINVRSLQETLKHLVESGRLIQKKTSKVMSGLQVYLIVYCLGETNARVKQKSE